MPKIAEKTAEWWRRKFNVLESFSDKEIELMVGCFENLAFALYQENLNKEVNNE